MILHSIQNLKDPLAGGWQSDERHLLAECMHMHALVVYSFFLGIFAPRIGGKQTFLILDSKIFKLLVMT